MDIFIRVNFNVIKLKEIKEIIIYIGIFVVYMEENIFKINWIEFSFK